MESRRVFVDIGAYVGETVSVALDPIFRMSAVHAIEPSPIAVGHLAQLRNDRLRIHQVALSDHDGQMTLLSEGSVGASFHSKPQPGAVHRESVVSVQRASEWFERETTAGDSLFVKLNVEGHEWEVIQDLAGSGWLERFQSLMVDFDVTKVPGREPLVQELTDMLDVSGVDYHDRRDWMQTAEWPKVPNSVRCWLMTVAAPTRRRFDRANASYLLESHRPLRQKPKFIARRCAPTVYRRMAVWQRRASSPH